MKLRYPGFQKPGFFGKFSNPQTRVCTSSKTRLWWFDFLAFSVICKFLIFGYLILRQWVTSLLQGCGWGSSHETEAEAAFTRRGDEVNPLLYFQPVTLKKPSRRAEQAAVFIIDGAAEEVVRGCLQMSHFRMDIAWHWLLRLDRLFRPRLIIAAAHTYVCLKVRCYRL